jgi:hypothetical protein
MEEWIKTQIRSTPVLSRIDFDYSSALKGLPDHPDFPKQIEIAKTRIWTFYSQTQEVLSQIQRKRGQFFDPSIKLNLKLLSQGEGEEE